MKLFGRLQSLSPFSGPRRRTRGKHRIRASRGSVLLIVVVLLLMLAILGTSYLSTTRVDRIVSGQELASANQDQLVQSVRDMAVSAILNGLYSYNSDGSHTFKGALPIGTPTVGGPPVAIVPYNNFDIPVYNHDNAGDSWLADRIPILASAVPNVSTYPTGQTANSPVWAAITAPLVSQVIGTGTATVSPLEFEDPTKGPGAVDPTTGLLQNQYSPYNNNSLKPGSLNPQLPVYPTSSGVYPALAVLDATGSPRVYVAGDADGDGIADAGLVRLPGTYADGLTYYAGIRIIDNNSAINVNTAWDDQYDYSFSYTKATASPIAPSSGNLFPSVFTTAVGLNQLLAGYNSTGTGTDPIFNLTQYRVGGVPPYTALSSPIDDYRLASNTDFLYGSLGDAIYHQLSQRVENPGFVDTSGDRYQSLGASEGAALAYHFCLINSNVDSVNSSTYSTVDELLGAHTLLGKAGNMIGSTNVPAGYSATFTSYHPADVNAWFAGNGFNVPNKTPFITLPVLNPRPFLVTRNGVSTSAPMNSPSATTATVANAAMPPYGDRGRWSAQATYSAGDCVTWSGVTNVSGANAPGNQFSGVFFATRPLGVNGTANTPPVSGQSSVVPGNAANPQTSVLDSNWARPSNYTPGATYKVGDYVYLDGNTATNLNDAFRFYVASKAQSPATTAPSLTGTGSLSWTAWTPSAPLEMLKANINTATFPELFRAYWNVMTAPNQTTAALGAAGTWGAQTTPFGPSGASGVANIYDGEGFTQGTIQMPSTAVVSPSLAVFHPQRMFRSPVRENRRPANGAAVYFDPYQVLLLRAAIAAVNAETLRSAATLVPTGNSPPNSLTPTEHVVISRQIPLLLNTSTGPTPVNVVVYGNQPQLFIREIAAEMGPDEERDYGGDYIAVELYNPNSVQVDASNWQIYSLNRPGGPSLTAPTLIDTLPAQTFVGPNSYLLLENFAAAPPRNAPPPKIPQRPPGIATSGLPDTGFPAAGAGGNIYRYSANLSNVIGNELLIMRPRNSALPDSIGTDGNFTWNESNWYDMAPVDSFDFTGLSTTVNQNVHYLRPNSPGSGWDVAYPGRYDGFLGSGRQEGTSVTGWPTIASPPLDPWDPQSGTGPPGSFIPPTPAISWLTASNTSTYAPNFPIKLSDANWAGQSQVTAGHVSSFPFGGFARNGDILEVPFIGAYEVRSVVTTLSPTPTIYEVNSVTMDAAMAEDTDSNDDPQVTSGGTVVQVPAGTTVEQLGRFCPIFPTGQAGIDDSTRSNTSGLLHYGWARSLFDYLTVQDPHNDFTPAVDPSLYLGARTASGTTPSYPYSIANSDSSALANTDAENTQSVQGLVNINTAPMQVLETLPLAVSTNGVVDQPNTATIAQNIVAQRQGAGPFSSLFDLNATTLSFQTGGGNTLAGTLTTFGQGNLTPGTGIPNNFDESELNLTRLSNLITTRSDVFTVYIVVEGWKNAGTPNASLAVTRRAAYIVDRSTVTPTSRAVKITPIPNN